MTLKTTLPSDDEIKKIADELDGLEETFSKSQKESLKNLVMTTALLK
jgi:restriction endonuclease S subunit